MKREYIFITSSDEISEEVFQSIHQLDSQQFPNPWSLSAFKDFLIGQDFLLTVVYENKSIVGFTLFNILFVDSFAHLLKIVIDNSVRGKKIGFDLLIESMNYLEKLNILKFFLEVEQTNQSAINLYSKVGFKIVHLNKNFYGTDRHALIMTRNL